MKLPAWKVKRRREEAREAVSADDDDDEEEVEEDWADDDDDDGEEGEIDNSDDNDDDESGGEEEEEDYEEECSDEDDDDDDDDSGRNLMPSSTSDVETMNNNKGRGGGGGEQQHDVDEDDHHQHKQPQQDKKKKIKWKQLFGKAKYQSLKSVTKTKLKIDVYKKQHGELRHLQARLVKRMERFGRQYMYLTLLSIHDEKNEIKNKQKIIIPDGNGNNATDAAVGDFDHGDEEPDEVEEMKKNHRKRQHKQKMKLFRLIRRCIHDCHSIQRKIDKCESQIKALEYEQTMKLKSAKKDIYKKYEIMPSKKKKTTADASPSDAGDGEMEDTSVVKDGGNAYNNVVANNDILYEPTDPILRMDSRSDSDDDNVDQGDSTRNSITKIDEDDEGDGNDDDNSIDINNNNGQEEEQPETAQEENKDAGDVDMEGDVDYDDEYDDFDNDDWVNDYDETADDRREVTATGATGEENNPNNSGFGSSNNNIWMVKEFHYNGKALYDTIGKLEKVKGKSILDAYKTNFLPNPNKYVALCYQSNMLQLPSHFHSYTLVHRAGTVGFRPSIITTYSSTIDDEDNDENNDNDEVHSKDDNDDDDNYVGIDEGVSTIEAATTSGKDDYLKDENKNSADGGAAVSTSVAWLTMLRYDYAVIPPMPKPLERNILPAYAKDEYTDTEYMRTFTNPKNTSVTYHLQTILPGRGMGSAADYNGGFAGGGDQHSVPVTNNTSVSLWGIKGYPVPQHCIQSRYLSNCWLVSGIASLAEYNNGSLIKHIFRKTPKRYNITVGNDVGTMPPYTDGSPNRYVVSLYDLTTWEEVDYEIDERLFLKYNDTYDLIGARPPIESKATTDHQEGYGVDNNSNNNSSSYNDFNESTVIGRTSMWDITKAASTDSTRPSKILSRKTEINLPLWVCYLEKAVAIHCGGWDHINLRSAPNHAWSILTGQVQTYQILLNYRTNKFKCIARFDPDIPPEENDFLSNSPKQEHTMNRVPWPTKAKMKKKVDGGNDDKNAVTKELTKDQLFQRMCIWKERNNWIIAAGTKGDSDENVTEEGIVDNHVYSILRCLKNVADAGVDLLYVRNPYGKGELTKGLFSDWTGVESNDEDSSNSGSASEQTRSEGGQGWIMYPQIRRELKPKSRDDGCFWITKDEFFQFFEAIFLSTWEDNGTIGPGNDSGRNMDEHVQSELEPVAAASQKALGSTVALVEIDGTASTATSNDVDNEESLNVAKLRQQVKALQNELRQRNAVNELQKSDVKPKAANDDSESSSSSSDGNGDETKKGISSSKLKGASLKALQNEIKEKDELIESQKAYIAARMKDAKSAIEEWKIECESLRQTIGKMSSSASPDDKEDKDEGNKSQSSSPKRPNSKGGNLKAQPRTKPSESSSTTTASPKKPTSKKKIPSGPKKPRSVKRKAPPSPKKSPGAS